MVEEELIDGTFVVRSATLSVQSFPFFPNTFIEILPYGFAFLKQIPQNVWLR